MNEDRKVMMCPLAKEPCVDGRVKSFNVFADDKTGAIPQCRFWTHVIGKDPQSNKSIDQHDCAIYWMPIAMLEGSQMTRFVNESVTQGTKAFVAALPTEAQQKVAQQLPILFPPLNEEKPKQLT